MRSHYIGARYIPLVYEGPDGSPDWLPGVAYDGLVIVTYGTYSYMSKKPVPAGMDPPDVNTAYWIKATVYNADVNNVVELLDQKADKDGVYPDLFAGNLISNIMQTDNAPYLERETGGDLTNIAPLCYPTLVGASVVENQLCNGESVTVQNGHKYYLKKSGDESLGASTGTAITGLTSGSDIVIDLMQMLGSAIADYVYSLEQATAGSGIAWLRSYGFIPDEYKPYNTGTIESVEATAKVVRDANGENAVTYSLGNDVLRGVFKLAGDKLYADGDRKEADGTITRKMKSKTLEQVNVTYSLNNSGYSNIAYARITKPSDAKGLNSAAPLLILLEGYVTSSATSEWDTADKIGYLFYGADTAYWWVGFPHGTTIEQMKTALAGKELIYELATPTTEQSTPFTSPQIVYPDGTEEFVTENGVPAGHDTSYPYDLKGILETLAEVPAADGTYTLKATRSGANITYTWDQEV